MPRAIKNAAFRSTEITSTDRILHPRPSRAKCLACSPPGRNRGANGARMNRPRIVRRKPLFPVATAGVTRCDATSPLPRPRRLALAILLAVPQLPRRHRCLVGPEPAGTCSGIMLNLASPGSKTPPGRAPCDALPSVRSRAARRAQVSVRGDGGTSSSCRRPNRRPRRLRAAAPPVQAPG